MNAEDKAQQPDPAAIDGNRLFIASRQTLDARMLESRQMNYNLGEVVEYFNYLINNYDYSWDDLHVISKFHCIWAQATNTRLYG